jgi:hypothetical protein
VCRSRLEGHKHLVACVVSQGLAPEGAHGPSQAVAAAGWFTSAAVGKMGADPGCHWSVTWYSCTFGEHVPQLLWDTGLDRLGRHVPAEGQLAVF